MMVEAFPHFAKLLLIEADASEYKEHLLCADLLLHHHMTVLSNMCLLRHFIVTYRRIHSCGRPLENVESVFNRQFPLEVPQETSPPPKAAAALPLSPAPPEREPTL